MAYDRNDTRETPRDERSRWRDERFEGRDRAREERGFFERAGDEVASWFGDDEAERRRREDQMREERERSFSERERGYGQDSDRDRGRRDWYETRGLNERGGWSERDYNPSWRRELRSTGERDENRFRDRGRDYRPMTGDYGRSEQFF
ncbi:MAG: SWFGD domain-containing protein, partial [Sphingomicrobium sp.]